MIQSPPEVVLVDPLFHGFHQIGVEQDGEFLGIYTACCYSDPELDRLRWTCGGCHKVLNVYTQTGYSTVFELARAKGAPTALTEWFAEWFGLSFNSVETFVEFSSEA